jgi:hypothetical protein
MRMLESLAPETPSWCAARPDQGDMTIATPAHVENETHSLDLQESTARLSGLPLRDWAVSHEASLAASALGSKTVIADGQRRWPAGEDDIVAAAISVIFVALFVIIAVAAAAVLTMG